jgi:hypothetical protein
VLRILIQNAQRKRMTKENTTTAKMPFRSESKVREISGKEISREFITRCAL